MPFREIQDVTPLVKGWLKQECVGLAVEGSQDTDLKVFDYSNGQEPVWVVEVKGDQCDRNLNSQFHRALGQLCIARCTYRRARLSLALTSMWEHFVSEYGDVFQYLRASVLVVHEDGHITPFDFTSTPSRQPNKKRARRKRPRLGTFTIGSESHFVTEYIYNRICVLIGAADISALQELQHDKDENVRKAATAGIAAD